MYGADQINLVLNGVFVHQKIGAADARMLSAENLEEYWWLMGNSADIHPVYGYIYGDPDLKHKTADLFFLSQFFFGFVQILIHLQSCLSSILIFYPPICKMLSLKQSGCSLLLR